MALQRKNRLQHDQDSFQSWKPLHHEPTALTLSLYSPKELLALSTCSVEVAEPFNSLGHPMAGGIYDLRMGPYSDKDRQSCATCSLEIAHCPGHLGHIVLPLPVCNPLFYKTIHQVLKLSCLRCNQFRVGEHHKQLFLAQMKLLEKGLVIAAEEAADLCRDPADDMDADEDTGRRKKRNKQEYNYEMLEKLKQFVQGEIEKAAEESVSQELETRTVEDMKKRNLKEFLRYGSSRGVCFNCGNSVKSLALHRSCFIYEGTALKDPGEQDGSSDAPGKLTKTELHAGELREHFRKLYTADPDLLRHLFPVLSEASCDFPTDLFFVSVLAVPPPKTRPCQFTGGVMTIHPQSSGLQAVVERVTLMKHIVKAMQEPHLQGELSSEAKDVLQAQRGETLQLKLGSTWKELQACVDHVLDREMKSSVVTSKSGWGLKQLIERKQGIFRMHMMGKRVNFAARTVITPDPNIDIDEIGLPEVFAKQLTYKVAVTPWNVEDLRAMVLNGPDVHPGAVFVEHEGGLKRYLDPKNRLQREAIAKTLLVSERPDSTNFVYRHLINGDAMLLNRQPTLHKPSIMSHRARVLRGEKVMRLHYSVCKSYNADFDGDEMNAHFPQNEVARSEAYHVVNVCKQYLVPKDGTPLQGLIQDHIIAGVKMTVRGRFFTRSEYQQHVYSALVDLPGRIKTLPPAILKPKPLWSGKQIISTIVLNLVPEEKEPPNLVSSSKIKPNLWEKQPPRFCPHGVLPAKKNNHNTRMCESEVIFSQGELLSGVLDKAQYGNTAYSLVHVFYELYGGHYSGKLLSAFSKIFTNFLHTEGFTLGVHDIVVTPAANKKRRKTMRASRRLGDRLAAKGVGLLGNDELSSGDVDGAELRDRLEAFHRESRDFPKKRMDIDRAYKDTLSTTQNDISNACIPRGLVKKFPENNLQLMVQAGAKGSTVNTMQISSLLGQIELEGKRPALMISGRSLPSFQPYDTQPRAGGFIDGRFMTGIRPQEFFFHCMAGREGLIDTAVKTSRSGYLQRCLIKLLEGLVVNYDMTVRDSDGSVVQFQYGEDAMDVCKSQYMNRDQLPFLEANIDSVLDRRAVKVAQKCTDQAKVAKKMEKNRRWVRKGNTSIRKSPFLKFTQQERSEVSQKSLIKINEKKGRSEGDLKLLEQWQDLSASEKSAFRRGTRPRPDPANSQIRPDAHFGCVSERLDALIENYVSQRSSDDSSFKEDRFKDMMYLKAMRALVEPGEPVGVLAAQSVGEPSTQMTLNTFHFAGRGDMNVTLGIPRLREILMVASANIKTPSMTIPFLPTTTDREKDEMRRKLNRVYLKDVLQSIDVTETVDLGGSGCRRQKLAKLRFVFLSKKYYRDKYIIRKSHIIEYFEGAFVKKLMRDIAKVSKEQSKIQSVTAVQKSAEKKGSRSEEDGAEDDLNKIERGGGGEGHVSSDEEELADDADATEARKKARQGDEDPDQGLSEDEEGLLNRFSNELENDDMDEKGRAAKEHDDGFSEDVEGDPLLCTRLAAEPADSAPIRAASLDADVMKRRNRVISVQVQGCIASVNEYEFDPDKFSWCELTLAFSISAKPIDLSNILRKSASSAVIHEVPRIQRALLIKNEAGETVLTTEGVNIQAMYEEDCSRGSDGEFKRKLDLGRLECNNIHDMATFYGIEAANRTIVREIVNVFKAYGIVVDPRHLTLIADYMTFDGTYKPFNRIGIENNPSPLQQMTFETATGFLRNATLRGKTDMLTSPSSCIVMGKPCVGGTNSFKVMRKVASSVKEKAGHGATVFGKAK